MENPQGSGFYEPPGVEAGTLLKSEKPNCWWAKTATLLRMTYLAAGQAQLAAEEACDEPADLIREVLRLSRKLPQD